jgi:hypothetical protein
MASAASRAPALPEGADPALAIERPDIERRVHAVIKPLTGTQVWCYALTEGDPSGWLTVASIQVDIRATGKAIAWRRADHARRLISAMPWAHDWADGVVCAVDTIDGPYWLPDPNGAPRYTARYRVVFHPARPSEEPEP